MNIHEHQAKQILKKFGAIVPEGVFGFTVSNLASFSYFCCGSAISLLLVGSTFLARFSTLISSGSIIILAINAYILRKKKNVQHFS